MVTHLSPQEINRTIGGWYDKKGNAKGGSYYDRGNGKYGYGVDYAASQGGQGYGNAGGSAGENNWNIQNGHDVAQMVRDYYQRKNSPATFGQPSNIDDQINNMPNAQKLTDFERWVYRALPGVSAKMNEWGISKQMDKFNDSIWGKGLQKLDVLAEGFERAVGFGEQMVETPGGWTKFDFSDENVKAAWYAGSLYWDTMNLPQLKKDENGKVIGLTVPEDLPGMDGVRDAQIKLKRLMEQGVDPKDALNQVRDEYYNGLGALGLRAQLNDFYGHFLGDPLNVILGYLKPIEALKARRLFAVTEKLAVGSEDLLKSAEKAGQLINTAQNAEEGLKAASEAFQLASMAGDAKKAAEYADKAAELARGLGRTEDIAHYEEQLAKLTTLGEKGAAKFAEDAAAALGKKQLNTFDKIAIALTGGDPLRPARFGAGLEKIPVVGRVLKTFNLTPESKARELLTLVSDNLSTNVISRIINSPNAEAEFVSYVKRVAQGATGLEYGHAMMTLEGRTVQAFVKGTESGVEHLFQTYQALGKERSMLIAISDVLGEAPSKLLTKFEQTPEVVMDLLMKKGGSSPAIMALLQSGELTPEALKSLAKVMGDMPYNKEMFFARAMDAIETQAMRQSIVQFGVSSKGLVSRWSDAMKAAESLAFLRLNPAYPFRNAINNEVTMLARGLFGVVTEDMATKFWEDFGSVPRRLGEALTPAQAEAAGKMSEAEKILAEAIRGGNYGTPEKAKEFFSKLNLGKADFVKLGQKFEQSASRRAFTLGTQQYLRKYFKPKSVREFMNPRVLDEIEQAAPGFTKHFDNVVRASGAMEKKFDSMLGTSLHLNVDSILDDVGRQTQTEMRDVLGDELLQHIHENLPAAIQNGTLDSFKVQTREMVNRHIEDLFQKQLENVVEHVKAQAVAGGQNVWAKKLGEAQDIFWGAHIEHSVRMPEATRLAREAASTGDYKAARALWQAEQADAAQFYGRAFKRVDAYIQGLEQGVTELERRGAQLPFGDIRRTFGEWQDGWKSFFQEKNRLMDDFWNEIDNLPKGQRPSQSIDDVRATIQGMYDKMAKHEDELAQRIDDVIAQTIDDPAARKSYMNARDTLAKMRLDDKKAVNEMYQRAAELPAEQRQAAWNQFWQQRTGRLQNMRSVEAASIAAQQGDPRAIQLFTEARSAQAKAATGEFDVYKMAEQYGVPATTTKGVRNDRRILNTINKYLGGGAKAAGEDLTKTATSVPRSDLPEAVSQRFEQWAQQLKRDLAEGEPGKRLRGTDIQGGAEVKTTIRVGSTNPDWYKELYSKGLRKPAIDKALDKIIKDNGLDTGATVERVKEIILENIRHGDRNHGVPPDLYALQEMGASKKTLKAALDDWNEVTKQDLTLEEALQTMTPSGLHDPTKPYYDEAGNLVTPSRYTNLKDVPEDVAKKAFEARAAEKGIPAKPPEVTPEFIADINKVIPNPAPMDLGIDMMTYGRSYGALDAVVEGAKAAAKQTPNMISDLPEHLQAEVRRAIGQVKNEFSGVRYRAMKFGEWRRDASLLNYNRRTNFDNMLGNFAPFVFWTTGSMMQWALESVDRPAMLTNYMRMKKLFATAGMRRDGMPSREAGKIRIQLPFAPEWMGEQFIDPLRVALPFDNWASPFEQMQQNARSIDGRAERVLQQQLQEGSITQAEYDQALQSHDGSVWDFAKTQAAGNDSTDTYDTWDFTTALASPHAPIMWAYNAAFGDKQDIPPFTPLSRLARNAATSLGVEDWNNSKWNLEAKVRRQMGLPAFDKWDDYRIDRALSDLAGEGKYSVDDVKEALAVSALVQKGQITSEQAKQMSEAYKEGVKRSNQEYTGGLGAFAMNLLGMPVTSVPKGELELRSLQDDFSNAYTSYKEANDSLQKYIDSHPELNEEVAQEKWAQANPKLFKQTDDLQKFFDDHPEYETRLGLFDKPEERLHKFFIDQVWARYNQLPDLNQREIRDQLGADFQDSFLNKNTRNYDEVPTELMSVWLKLMGTDPLGGLTADQRMLVSLYGKVQLTNPEVANRVQVFYDMRNQRYKNWFDTQTGYFNLPKGGQRSSYLAKHPELKQYWDFRTQFMRNNPDLVPYLTDDPKAIAKAKNQARTGNAVPTANEIQQMTANMPSDLKEIVYTFAQSGDQLPPVVLDELEYYAQSQGLDPQTMVNILGGGMGVR
ncbi:MAG TPA: hypothetical protein VIY48_13040 [Candidatus Paceibacterota bacterium]